VVDLSRPALRRFADEHPTLTDAGGGLLVGLAYLIAILNGGGREVARGLHGSDLAVSVVGVVAIALRRRWPVPIFLAVAAVGEVAVVGQWQAQGLFFGVLIVLTITMTLRAGDRRADRPLIGGTAVVLYVTSLVFADHHPLLPQNLGILAWLGLAAAAGEAIRNRRAYVAAVLERAERAEQTREQEAQRRVIEERLRIARELHDVLAHHIAVISVQAGVAAHSLERRPVQVRPALAQIRHSCDEVLAELGSLVGLLRRSDRTGTGARTEPTRGLGELPDLLDAAAGAGLRVEAEQRGAARELPAITDLAAYRITQEALTNAHKYGRGSARLTVSYEAAGLSVEVSNRVGDAQVRAGAPSTGFGIVGMRERATAAGGTLRAEPGPDGDFTVRAELPTPPVAGQRI
jgi:signal transduction histidine kinase